MKRLTASVLAMTLVLGSVPASAQTVVGRVSLGNAAPAPLVSAVIAAPLPVLTPSLVPATLRVAGLSALSAPIPVSPVAATPLQSLKAVAVPGGALAFDGSLSRSAPAIDEPPVAPEPAATPVKPGLLQRYKDARKKAPPLQTAFGRGLFLAGMSAAAAPVLLGAAPAMKLAYAVTAADLVIFAIIAPLSLGLWAWRKLRTPQTAAKPPPRSKKLLVFALGAALGVATGLAPYHATGPIVERVATYVDAKKAADEQRHVRWISGGVVEQETIKLMSQNPVGRATLDALRDRFGTLRLPTFFLSSQDDSYAQHESFFDGVYLNVTEITSRGWTVEQFLKDPALQRQLIREMDATVLHELTHAVQGRRAPWKPGYFRNAVEAEQEAFLQQTLYILARLEADPAARNTGDHQWMLVDAAGNLETFLKEVAELYAKNVVVGNDPDYNAYFAAQRARWPAFRVHIYQVLAARASTPASAKMYLERAKAAAKEAGLPEPASLVASR